MIAIGSRQRGQPGGVGPNSLEQRATCHTSTSESRGKGSPLLRRRRSSERLQTLGRVLGKRPEHTHVVIDEVEPENWGYAGVLTTEYRKHNPS